MPPKRPAPADFAATFAALRAILAAHAGTMVVVHDAPGNYYLNTTKPHPLNGRPLMFGAVKTMKNYVSFHLMPVYSHAPLQQGISPALRQRMQGKSCFNFTAPDAALLRELDALTARSVVAFRKGGFA
jgi:hypothetical protein